MALWTELCLAVEFKRDTPGQVIDWIKFLVNESDPSIKKPVKRPDHPLFKERTGNAPLYLELFHGESYSFAGTSALIFEYQESAESWHLTIRSAVRNYQREIEAFLMFLMPYVEPRGYAGYYRYEQDEYPCLIFFPEPGKLTVIDKIPELMQRTNGVVKPLLSEESE